MYTFQILAEYALNGRYQNNYAFTVASDLSQTGKTQEMHYWLQEDIDDYTGIFYNDATPEEQCMFLLFFGEMYDHP